MDLEAVSDAVLAVPVDDAAGAVLPTLFSADAEEILSLVGDGVVSIDRHGRILLFNRAAEDLFGYSSQEMVGCRIDVLIPVRFRERHRQDIANFVQPTAPVRRAMGAGRALLGLHKNGRELAIEVTLSRNLFSGQPTFTAVIRDVTDRETADQRRQLIAGEVAHRLRNTMAVVNSIVALTARGATSLPGFVSALTGRFTAISHTNDALTGDTWATASLEELLRFELAPYGDSGDRVTLAGPAVRIDGKLALAVALVFHELATNAAKHGALSVPAGQIRVDWELSLAEPQVLKLVWRERGGPVLTAPARKSFGSHLIARSLASYSGTADLIFEPSGARCTISLPLVFG